MSCRASVASIASIIGTGTLESLVGSTHIHSPAVEDRRAVRRLALLASLLLHGALVYALSRVPWPALSVAEAIPDTPTIVLGRLVRPEPRPPFEPPLPDPSVREPPTQPPVAPEPPPLAPAPESTPEPVEIQAAPDEPPQPETAEEGSRDAAPRDDADEAVVAESQPLPSATEIYEEGHAVAVLMVEERERERRYSAFSTDLFDEPAPPPPNPRADMFEPGAGGKGSRAFMQPGRARTRFGRWLSDTCNALTGGISVMGFASLCAEETARSDLFADIKPEYLKSLPVCEQVDAASPLADAGERFAIKCRLVRVEE